MSPIYAAWIQLCARLRGNDPFEASPLRRTPYLAVTLFIAATHFCSSWLGNLALTRTAQGLPAFPGAGLDTAVLLVFGLRYWPVLPVVYLPISIWRGVPWLPACGIALAGLSRAVAAVWLLRWISGMKKVLGAFEDLTGTVAAAIVAPAVAAGLGVSWLMASGLIRPFEWAGSLGRWWMADALSILVVLPVLLGAARFWHGGRHKSRRSSAPVFAYAICVALACYFIFFRAGVSYVLFSVFLLILFAAAWLGPTVARVTATEIAAAAIWATRAGVGPFSGATLDGNLRNLALFVAAVCLTGMAVGAFRAVSNLALPGGVLLAGWALSGWLYASLDRDRVSYDEARFDKVITAVGTRIDNRFQTYEEILWGAAGHLAATKRMSPDDWRTYVRRLHLQERYPGTTAISIVQPVAHEQLKSFIQARRRSQWPGFTAHTIEAGVGMSFRSKESFLVICAEPATVAAAAIGADVAGDPFRRAAAEQARDSGAAVLSRSTVLGDGSGKGLQLFVPVYREGAPLKTPEERRSALMAWVNVAFSADSFFRSVLAELQGTLSLQVYDGEQRAPEDQFFLSDRLDGKAPRPERITHLTLAGSEWTLCWRRLPSFPYLSRAPSAWAAGCTALLTLLSAGLVMSLQATRRRASDRLKMIEAASTLGTWELDLHSRTVQCSEQLGRLYGIHESRERFPLDEWLGYVHPEDRPAVMADIAGGRAGRESIDRQYRVIWPDGSVHWLHSRALPFFNDQGQQTRIIGVDFDISETKQLQSQLAQAQKLESVGHLAAGVAHEINTPIQYVGDNGKFLEDAFRDLIRLSDAHRGNDARRPGEGETPGALGRTADADEGMLQYLKSEIPKAIAQLLEGVDQVARIVRAMKEFSHPGAIETAAIDINRAIESTILVSRNEWKYVAELTTDFDPSVPPVPGVVGELNQVVLNLIVNAAHAIAEVVKDSGRKGRIHIRTRRRDTVAEISISDTGVGIPSTIQSKVFNPFFTTKPIGKGTGQGLAIAHSIIVQKHKGTLTFQSEPGCGTTFIIQLPLACELETA